MTKDNSERTFVVGSDNLIKKVFGHSPFYPGSEFKVGLSCINVCVVFNVFHKTRGSEEVLSFLTRSSGCDFLG